MGGLFVERRGRGIDTPPLPLRGSEERRRRRRRRRRKMESGRGTLFALRFRGAIQAAANPELRRDTHPPGSGSGPTAAGRIVFCTSAVFAESPPGRPAAGLARGGGRTCSLSGVGLRHNVGTRAKHLFCENKTWGFNSIEPSM